MIRPYYVINITIFALIFLTFLPDFYYNVKYETGYLSENAGMEIIQKA